MKIPFWSYDRSPKVDAPNCFLKPNDASERLSKGYVRSVPGGVQQKAPIGYTADARNIVTAATTREAWKTRESSPPGFGASGTGYLVLQFCG